MANSSYWNDGTGYAPMPIMRSIMEEVHLVKPGEFRKLDYNIYPYSNFSSNVALNLDYGRNGFYLMEPEERFMDSCGFVRVVISYSSEG